MRMYLQKPVLVCAACNVPLTEIRLVTKGVSSTLLNINKMICFLEINNYYKQAILNLNSDLAT